MNKQALFALCSLVLLDAPILFSPFLAAQETTSADDAGEVFQRPKYVLPLPAQEATSAAGAGKYAGQKTTENSIPVELTNRELLANAKWTDAAFVQAITSGWERYTGTQHFENVEGVAGAREELYTKEIQMYGAVFSASVRRFKSDGAFEFVFVNKDSDSFSKDFREKFMSFAVKAWGAPSKDIDNLLSDKEMGTDSHDVEWLLGNTQIKFTFSGLDMYGRRISSICALIVTQNGKYPPLKDLIALKCEGQATTFAPGAPSETAPASSFVIIVDLNLNALLRQDKSHLGKITRTSEDYYAAEWQDKDTKNRFTINRKLGTFEWETTLLANENYRVVKRGNCEKVNLQTEPKF
jgi:hypothetical protein